MNGFSYASIVLPMVAAFLITALSGKWIIPMLKKLHAQQTERDDGPKTHQSKTGTPNMGGLMIMLSVIVLNLILAVWYPEVLPVLLLTVGFSFVGFLDDYIKGVKKRSMGLRVWQKLLLQIVIAVIFAVLVSKGHNMPLAMKVPFAHGVVLDLGVFNIPMLVFVAVATVNGTNFTDGVDGLASSVTVAVALFFTLAAVLLKSGVAPAGAVMAGALLGFLFWNAHPAKVFMGDTGSLALGGFVTGMAYMLQLPLFIPIVGFLYMLEVISVIIQVLYFKATHGKRFFRMAPIHHHFELGGWSETKVTTVFTAVTILLSAVGLLGLW